MLILGDQTSSFSPEQEPQSFPASGAAIIAPFWARADYLSTSSRGKVYYRVSESSVLLDMAEQELAQAHGQANVNPSQLVIVTWKDLRSPTDNTVSRTTYTFELQAVYYCLAAGLRLEGSLALIILPVTLSKQTALCLCVPP